MATLLQTEGHQISVITPKIYKESHWFEDQDGVRVYRFPFFSGNKLLIEYDKIPYLRMILYYISGFFFTLFVFLRNRCNLIHAHWAIPTGLIGVLVGALLRKPLVVTIHGSDFRMAMDGPSYLKRIFVYILKQATHITCVSEVQKKRIQEIGIPEKQISIFPMGVDKIFIEIRSDRKRNGHGNPLTVLSNRNLLPIYNVSLLIRAAAIVLKREPEVRFLIAGEGSEREVLEREAKSLHVSSSVHFLGRVLHEKMAAILGETDLYISTSFYDGTSVSLLEAMASGAFPIVTDILSNREWISDRENGLLFSVGNESLLAAKIIEALSDPQLRMQAYEKNYRIIRERANWHRNIERMVDIYENCQG